MRNRRGLRDLFLGIPLLNLSGGGKKVRLVFFSDVAVLWTAVFYRAHGLPCPAIVRLEVINFGERVTRIACVYLYNTQSMLFEHALGDGRSLRIREVRL